MPGSGDFDMEHFFRCSAWDVPNADVWRWRACVEAIKKMRKKG